MTGSDIWHLNFPAGSRKYRTLSTKIISHPAWPGQPGLSACQALWIGENVLKTFSFNDLNHSRPANTGQVVRWTVDTQVLPMTWILENKNYNPIWLIPKWGVMKYLRSIMWCFEKKASAWSCKVSALFRFVCQNPQISDARSVVTSAFLEQQF